MISNILSAPPVIAASNKISSARPAGVSSSPSASGASSMVNISAQAQLNDLSARYDVTHMSDLTMGKLASELKENGMISEREFADMSLVIKPPGGTYHPDAPKNFLMQYQYQFEHSKRYSTPEDSKMLDRLSNLLQSLHEARAISQHRLQAGLPSAGAFSRSG